jgi:hypothetical protein
MVRLKEEGGGGVTVKIIDLGLVKKLEAVAK